MKVNNSKGILIIFVMITKLIKIQIWNVIKLHKDKHWYIKKNEGDNSSNKRGLEICKFN